MIVASDIILQGKNSHISMQNDQIICSAKKTCTINLAAKTTNSHLIYSWDFGDGTTFTGKNPKARKMVIGSYIFHVRTLDSDTGERSEKVLRVIIKKLATKSKKTKVSQAKNPTQKINIKTVNSSAPTETENQYPLAYF